ncbi:MAG: hypothetical protein U0R18_19905 [Mycobacterium sp.]
MVDFDEIDTTATRDGEVVETDIRAAVVLRPTVPMRAQIDLEVAMMGISSISTPGLP